MIEKRDAEIEKVKALRELREELIENARKATGKDSLESVKKDKDWLENTQMARAHIKGLEKKLEQRRKSPKIFFFIQPLQEPLFAF